MRNLLKTLPKPRHRLSHYLKVLPRSPPPPKQAQLLDFYQKSFHPDNINNYSPTVFKKQFTNFWENYKYFGLKKKTVNMLLTHEKKKQLQFSQQLVSLIGEYQSLANLVDLDFLTFRLFTSNPQLLLNKTLKMQPKLFICKNNIRSFIEFINNNKLRHKVEASLYLAHC